MNFREWPVAPKCIASAGSKKNVENNIPWILKDAECFGIMRTILNTPPGCSLQPGTQLNVTCQQELSFWQSMESCSLPTVWRMSSWMQKVAWNKKGCDLKSHHINKLLKPGFRVIDNQKGRERQILIMAVRIHRSFYFTHFFKDFWGCLSLQQKIQKRLHLISFIY